MAAPKPGDRMPVGSPVVSVSGAGMVMNVDRWQLARGDAWARAMKARLYSILTCEAWNSVVN